MRFVLEALSRGGQSRDLLSFSKHYFKEVEVSGICLRLLKRAYSTFEVALHLKTKSTTNHVT